MLGRLLALTLGLSLAMVLGACASSPSPTPNASTDDDRKAIEGVLYQQQDAWNKGDLDGYMAGYAKSDDLEFTSPSGTQKGWQATYDKYKAKYATEPGKMGQLLFVNLAVVPGGPDSATVTGRWILKGTEHDASGGFTLTFEKLPEGWKIIRDVTTVEAMQPE